MACKCQECGKLYKLDLLVPDELWEQIKPKGKKRGAGLLCSPCIMRKIERICGYSAWNLIKI